MILDKWCEHCQKNTHNDDECWSTRAVFHEVLGYKPPRHNQLNASLSKITLTTDAALLELLKNCNKEDKHGT